MAHTNPFAKSKPKITISITGPYSSTIDTDVDPKDTLFHLRMAQAAVELQLMGMNENVTVAKPQDVPPVGS